MIECLIYSWPTSRYLVIDYLLIGIFFLIVRVSDYVSRTIRFRNLAQYYMQRYPTLDIEVETEIERYQVRNIYTYSLLLVTSDIIHDL